MTTQSFSGCHELPAGTCLHQTYQIQKTIGAGGFGITYLAVRKDTGHAFAIKEYFPSSLAVRNVQEGSYALQPFPEKNAEAFQKGRQRFLNEAKILKSFPDPESTVSVYDLFEENDTIYLVMEYIDGLTLSRYIQENGPLTFPETAELMAPIIRSLSKIHEKGLIHRDISPDNLILGIDNRLHLIDFGAAGKNIPGNRKNTVILKAGYAPPEQYIPNGSTGAWTDVYGICATMYFTLTGLSPAEAVERLDPSCPPPLSIPNLLPWQSALLEKGLQLHPASRFQTAEELSRALEKASERAEDAVTELKTNVSKKDRAQLRKFLRHSRSQRTASFIGITVLCTALVCAVLLFVLSTHSRPQKQGKTSFEAPYATPHESAFISPAPAIMSEAPAAPALTAAPAPSEPSAAASGPALLTMPDLTGKQLAKAKKQLHKLDDSIRIDVSYVYSSSKKAETVLSQSVRKGSSFSKKQIRSISLTVSKGKKPSDTQSPKPKPAAKKPADFQVRDDNDFSSIPLE